MKAIEFQKRSGSKIVVIHAIEYQSIPQLMPLTIPFQPTFEYAMPAIDYARLKEQYHKAGQRVIDEAKEAYAKQNASAEFRLVETTNPADYVKNSVVKEGFDLVIIGCKGHKKLESIFIGSFAQKMLNELKCDVLVIR